MNIIALLAIPVESAENIFDGNFRNNNSFTSKASVAMV